MKKKLKFLKFSNVVFDGTSSHDIREVLLCKELGLECIVLSKETMNKVEIDLQALQDVSLLVYPSNMFKCKLFNFIYGQCYCIKKMCSLQPDIISCHDMKAVLFAWISTWFSKKKPKLVYDCHEFAIKEGNYSKIKTWFITFLERFLIKKCTFSIMVSDSIADEIMQIHKLKERPIVARNIPKFQVINFDKVREIREEFLKKFGLSKSNDAFIIMYHGGISKARRVETLIKILKSNDDLYLVILGYGKNSYINELKDLVKNLKLENRVIFMSAVSQKELFNYIAAVDLDCFFEETGYANSEYCLPNKFFETIQSETVLCYQNTKEISKIVSKYDIGLMADSNNIEQIANSIGKLKNDKVLYNKMKKNVIKAKNELCWEKEKIELKNRYSDLIKLMEERKNDTKE